MSKRDYYEVLGVSRNATDEELKKAYRKLAVQHHPDRNSGDKKAEEQFKEVNEAYQILSESKKRTAYDRFGHAGVGAGEGFSGGGFSDIFDNIFGDFFNAGTSQNGGVDLRYHLQISFEEAAFGVEKKIEFEKESSCSECAGTGAQKGTKATTCKTCRGAGQVRFNQGFFTLTRTCATCHGRGSTVEHRCKVCHGKGVQKRTHQVSVKIPAGIDTDQRLRVKGEGETSGPGSKQGDLYVQVEVLPHALFRRQAEHIFLEVPISFAQAALGVELEVPTLGGFSKLKIPPGIQSGEMLRLKGKGIVRLNGSGFGDQIVSVLVETPVSLSSRQRELLEAFEKETVTGSHPHVSSFLKKIKEIFK